MLKTQGKRRQDEKKNRREIIKQHNLTGFIFFPVLKVYVKIVGETISNICLNHCKNICRRLSLKELSPTPWGGLVRLVTPPGAFGKKEVTMCPVHIVGTLQLFKPRQRKWGNGAGGGMGPRKWIKRENGPKLSAVALHVMKACIVWSCESK